MKTFLQVVLFLLCYAAFVVMIVAAALDLALVSMLWDKVPTDLHIRLFAWHGLLIINMVCTALAAFCLLSFTLIWKGK